MGRTESENQGGIGALRRLPENRILVPVPLESKEYQAFLEANRLREQAREKSGGPDPEAEEAYRKAVGDLSQFAASLYGQKRAS